jgi:hypothetical protein
MIMCLSVQPVSSNTDVTEKNEIYAVVTKLSGTANIYPDKGVPVQIKQNTVLSVSSKIETDKKSSLELVFEDGSVLRAESETAFLIIKSQQSKKKERYISIKLIKGRVVSNVIRSKAVSAILSYNITTPVALSAVRGTIFVVSSLGEKDADFESEVAVFDGQVFVQAIDKEERLVGKEVTIEKEQETSVKFGLEPLPPHPIEKAMMEYRDTVVKQFNERAEDYRKNMNQIHDRVVEWMDKNKKDYENKMDDKKRKYEQKMEEQKKKYENK